MFTRYKRTIIGTVLCLAFIGFVWVRHLNAAPEPWESQINQKVTVIGEVADDPVVSQNGWTEFHLYSPVGKLGVRTHHLAAQRGFTVQAEGKLQKDRYTGDPEFSFATTKIISRQQTVLEQIRQRFMAGMRNALPEPLSSMALGLLLGTRALIPKALQDQLAAVGLAHIVAVSGYNLTIIIEVVRGPLARWSRRLGLWLTLLFITTFVALTGGSASIVRAAVVSVLSLLAAYYGRRIKPALLLSLAAALTLVWQPSYLWADLGWRLSFAAFFGILVLAPAIERRYISKPNWLKSLIVQSLSAQIMTAPIIMLAFGRFSIVAPLSNLLILPLVPLAMLLALVAGLAGMLAPALSGWLGWPAFVLLKLMLDVVNKLAGHSWTEVSLRLDSLQTGLLYLMLMLLLATLARYNGLSKRASNVRTL